MTVQRRERVEERSGEEGCGEDGEERIERGGEKREERRGEERRGEENQWHLSTGDETFSSSCHLLLSSKMRLSIVYAVCFTKHNKSASWWE